LIFRPIVSLNSIKSRFSQVKLEPKQLSNLKKYIESLSLPGILSGNFQNFFDALDFHIKQPSAPITSAQIFSLIKSNFKAEQIPFVVDFLASAKLLIPRI
jgi:flagellar hook-associated protein FlgK